MIGDVYVQDGMVRGIGRIWMDTAVWEEPSPCGMTWGKMQEHGCIG